MHLQCSRILFATVLDVSVIIPELTNIFKHHGWHRAFMLRAHRPSLPHRCFYLMTFSPFIIGQKTDILNHADSFQSKPQEREVIQTKNCAI